MKGGKGGRARKPVVKGPVRKGIAAVKPRPGSDRKPWETTRPKKGGRDDEDLASGPPSRRG